MTDDTAIALIARLNTAALALEAAVAVARADPGASNQTVRLAQALDQVRAVRQTAQRRLNPAP